MISVVIRKDQSGQYADKNEVSRVNPVVAWNGTKQLLKEASSTSKAFEATDEKLNDKVPW
jgi:hypothetical protein